MSANIPNRPFIGKIPMTTVNLILCFIQGIGEFLPISSSGHMLAFEKLFSELHVGLDMHVTLHFGSLLALIIYFFKDICSMFFGVWMRDLRGLRKHPSRSYRDLAWILVLASIPTIIVGLIIKKTIGSPSENITIVGISSIVFGLLMIIADANPLKDTVLNFRRGFLIGLAQCLAIIPGASRFGLCLTMSRLLGLDRVYASRFAFLMAIPVLLGAFVLTMIDSENPAEFFNRQQLILITVVASLGILSIHFLFWLINRFSFFAFGIYRIIFGILLLTFF
jgi:undecaprenyl-diphosphatase